MNKENLSQLSLAELYDLLGESTQQLLHAINEKAEKPTLHNYQRNVETIQAVIKEKKTESLII